VEFKDLSEIGKRAELGHAPIGMNEAILEALKSKNSSQAHANGSNGNHHQADHVREIPDSVPAEESVSPHREDVPGAYQVPSEVAGILAGLDVYYDAFRTAFWIKNDRGNWIKVSLQDVRRCLEAQGFRPKAAAGELVSQIDALLIGIQRCHDVDYADSLAGFCSGVYQINGRRILVRDSPKLIHPQPGEWPVLKGILERMLGPEQESYLFGWLKVAIQSLHSLKPRVGQALVLAGPKNCGKSLLQNLITDLLGGRSSKPHRYMSGATPFNNELFGSEHLMIEDEESSTDIRARKSFGSKIKDICANVTQSCHPKHREALTLTPFWRLSVSVNDEPEDLMILPPVTESLEDKMIILKAASHPMPMPTLTNEDRERFLATLRAELPHFIHFLLHWDIPEPMRSQRYGVTHYHNSKILQALGELAPEVRMLEILDAVLFDSPSPDAWQGSAIELERKLTGDSSKLRREADKLFHFSNSCGTYLGRLQKQFPDRFELRHTRKGNQWTIEPAGL
jgi:hypothetical protein